ncbi:MAG: hypothetical protein ABIR15_11320 [Chitinophagaceae bacterium]
MKLVLYTFAAVFIFSSCQKELSFEITPANGTGTGTGTGGATSTDCKSCVYMPVCDGTWYTFADTLGTVASIFTDTLRFSKDTTIDSKTFTKIYSPASKTYAYYNCTDGATRLIQYNTTSLAGNTISKLDITFLKANLAVGGKWQDMLTNPLGQQVIYTDSIVAKGISRTINGKTFSDVIHVSVETGVNDSSIGGYFAFSVTDYYFAKGIGLIEALISYPSTGIVIEHRAIKSYYIP